MRRILVALDRSPSSRTVLARSVELAKSSGARLRLMRAVTLPPAPPPGALVERSDTSGRTAVLEAARAALVDLEREVPDALRDGIAVELGSAPQAICVAAKSYGADVVVMGARRRGVLRRALERSTASKVLDRIDRPVLVVRIDGPRAKRARRYRGPKDVGHGRDHADHPLLETTTLAGTATGAVVGSIGGLPGAIAGSFVGTAVGMIAGAALDADEKKKAQHDRELDVPGARPMVGEMQRAADALRREHDRLERIYADLLVAYNQGDWAEVRARWDAFEPALRAHMEHEEREILPAFRAVDPREADALVHEHDELRELLGTLAVLVDLHAVPARDAEELVARLQAHAVRERILLYPWIDLEVRDGPRPAPPENGMDARR